jgi:WD40 repeat protein
LVTPKTNTPSGSNLRGHVTGLNSPYSLALSQNSLYISSRWGGTIGEYNATTGEAINASLVTGGDSFHGLALSGNDFYVATYDNGTVAKYDATTGALINASFISGLSQPVNLAIGPIPEPSTYALFGFGALALIVAYRRKVA